MNEYIFLDWRPVGAHSIDPVYVFSGEYIVSVDDQHWLSLRRRVDDLEVIDWTPFTKLIRCFGFSERTDGLFAFYFEITDAAKDEIKTEEIKRLFSEQSYIVHLAAMTSHVIKAFRGHVHLSHQTPITASVLGRYSSIGDHRPVRLDVTGGDEIKLHSSVIFPSELVFKCGGVVKNGRASEVCRAIAENDSVLFSSRAYDTTFHDGSIRRGAQAILSIREGYAKKLDRTIRIIKKISEKEKQKRHKIQETVTLVISVISFFLFSGIMIANSGLKVAAASVVGLQVIFVIFLLVAIVSIKDVAFKWIVLQKKQSPDLNDQIDARAIEERINAISNRIERFILKHVGLRIVNYIFWIFFVTCFSWYNFRYGLGQVYGLAGIGMPAGIDIDAIKNPTKYDIYKIFLLNKGDINYETQFVIFGVILSLMYFYFVPTIQRKNAKIRGLESAVVYLNYGNVFNEIVIVLAQRVYGESAPLFFSNSFNHVKDIAQKRADLERKSLYWIQVLLFITFALLGAVVYFINLDVVQSAIKALANVK